MSTSYEVQIELDGNAADELMRDGYKLYGFKAVKTGGSRGAPLVWFQSNPFSTTISWTERYLAYDTHEQDLTPRTRITAHHMYPIELGQTLQVIHDEMGEVQSWGETGTIAILNSTQTPLTCGIAELAESPKFSSPAPTCAFPLYGNFQQTIIPIEKILLMFSTQILDPGTVTQQAYSEGVLIDLADQPTRAIKYDTDQGWISGSATWASRVKPNEDLVSILIVQ